MKTILVVDDTPENLYLLRVIFEQAGYRVVEANDGKEGLSKLQKNNVDLIISDILMPVMDGYMFCQACKKDKAFKNIPFVFYTSTYTAKPDEDFALKLGASHFLRKPTDPDKILELAEKIFTDKKPKGIPKAKVQFSEQEVLKLYSKRLISKLEHKNLDLEKEILERKKAEQKLINENVILDLISKNTSLEHIFNHIILNYESHHPDYFGSISLLHDDGIHLNLVSAPTMPKAYNLEIKQVKIGKKVGSSGAAAFSKKPVIVSDICTNELWVDYKDIAQKHNLKSCWSIPILSEEKIVLGTFAIYSNFIKTPSLEDIRELNSAVNLAKIAIVKFNVTAEVKKRDESYKSLINQASDGIISYSPEGVIYDFNKAAYNKLGYSKKEFLNFKIQDFIVGDFIKNPARHKKILEGKSELFERQIICKNGSLIDSEISAKLQKDGKILAIVRDVTERRKAEMELKASKEFSESLINSMQNGLSVIDVNGKHIHVNPALCKMTGYSEKELLGVLPPFPFWPPEYYDEINEILDKTLLGIDKSGETVFKRKNGERFPVQLNISKVKDEEDKDVAFFAAIEDVSVKVKAREELKAAKAFTDKLIMSMQEGLIIINLEGKIIMVNESTCDILGYSRDELIGLSIPYPFVDKNDSEKILKTYKELVKSESLSFKIEFIRKNGEKFLASFSSGNIKNDEGEVIALFGTLKDISEEEKAKKILTENAKKSLERKNVILELAGLVGSDYKKALKRITTLSAQIINVERASVLKFNNTTTETFCENLYTKKSNSYDRGLVLKKEGNEDYFNNLSQNIIVNAPDALNNKLTKGFAKDYLLPLGICSKLSVPIQGGDVVYGILCFENVGAKREWSADDEEFATSIASIVSLMIESSERKIAENNLVLANTELSKANIKLQDLRDQLEQENLYLRNELDLVFNYEEMVYGSEEFSNVLTEVEKVAPTNATVLLLGESGTGKELLARAIHNTGLRNKKPLIKVNCSAIPRELMESELFGHKKGSFTGAISDKIGKFELADGGTLFLDEIGELPLDMQPKILRFLQEGEIEVVGGTELKKLDVRVIAATNRNLKEEIEKKQFREDLYFRINVFPILVPPLRKRKDDIPLLVEHFVDKFNKSYEKSIKYIPSESMDNFKSYNWPGNIRELENLIERAVILSDSETLMLTPVSESSVLNKVSVSASRLTLNEVQRNHIIKILEMCDWKIDGENGASKMLDIKPSTLRDRMKKLAIKKPTKI